MKILGKNIVIGTKKICMEYTSKIDSNVPDRFLESYEYKGKKLESNVVFIIDKNGYLIEVKELGSFPTLSLICYGAAKRWKTSPCRAGDEYIDEIRPYFTKEDQESLFDLKILLTIIKNKKSYTTKENSVSTL